MSDVMQWRSPSETAPDRASTSSVNHDHTRYSSDLVHETGHLRDRSEVLNDDVRSLDHEARRRKLDDLANALAQRGLLELLESARGYGFAWRTIADVVGVSVPALRKWRRGGNASPDNLHAVAGLVAACQVAERMLSPTRDVAAWFELPLAPHHMTRLDLYVEGHIDELFDLASERTTASAVLDRVRPDWRSETSDFEVVQGEDGQPAIVRRQET